MFENLRKRISGFLNKGKAKESVKPSQLPIEFPNLPQLPPGEREFLNSMEKFVGDVMENQDFVRKELNGNFGWTACDFVDIERIKTTWSNTLRDFEPHSGLKAYFDGKHIFLFEGKGREGKNHVIFITDNALGERVHSNALCASVRLPPGEGLHELRERVERGNSENKD